MNDTREKIIKAARELFEINGFSAATTKEIAEKAGVSEVTLFRHFETKRNLFEQTVHSCMHPYKLQEYLENEVQYDLETDLKAIANNMMHTFRKNIPFMKMVFKDRMKGSVSKIHLKQHENKAKSSLKEYFVQMQKMGRIKADPNMALMFFINNVSGYFMKSLFTSEEQKYNQEYFDWMVERIIFALEN